MVNLEGMTTEARNPKSENFSSLSVSEAVALMNEEDLCCIQAVRNASGMITQVIEHTRKVLEQGGRIIYAGAGTSGRLGLLDAVECPPTFGVGYDVVVGLIAGNENAFVLAKEGAEDSSQQGREDLENIRLTNKDALIGIAASGRTPYVLGALDYAKQTGAFTAAIVCNQHSEIEAACKHTIILDVGPEVLTGSTRLKAGTATKMVLNMISTISMTGLGKIYKNYMVDVKMTNEKLKSRGHNIVQSITRADKEKVEEALLAAGQEVKTAIVMIEYGLDARQARHLLSQANGSIDQIKWKGTQI